MLGVKFVTCITIVVCIVFGIIGKGFHSGWILAPFIVGLILYICCSWLDPPCQFLGCNRHDEISLQKYIDDCKRAPPTLKLNIACYHNVTTGSGRNRRTKRVYTHRASKVFGPVTSFTDVTPDFAPQFHTTRVSSHASFAFDTPARQQTYERMREDFYNANTQDTHQEKSEVFEIPGLESEGLFTTDYNYKPTPQHYNHGVVPMPATATSEPPPERHLPPIFNIVGYFVSLICLWNPIFDVLFYCFTGKLEVTFHKIIQQDPYHLAMGGGGGGAGVPNYPTPYNYGTHNSGYGPVQPQYQQQTAWAQSVPLVPYGPPQAPGSNNPAMTNPYGPAPPPSYAPPSIQTQHHNKNSNSKNSDADEEMYAV